MAVSYQQWYDEWDKSPWKGEWSQSDLDLAKLHPEFGMSMNSLKNDWHNATTPEQRALANEGAEYQRKLWGNYTGGTDGSQYYSLGPQHIEADALQQQITGYGPFAYSREPDYQGALDKVLGYGPFEYDHTTDPAYQAYAKQYAREGRRASEDTMGQYAAMTGGRPSTAAMTAAQQAGNYYSAQMADKIPELYQQAYQRYLQEYQRQLQALDAIDADRRFSYGMYGDDYNRLLNRYDTVRGQENAEREQQNAESAEKYQRDQDRLNRERQAMLDQYSMEQDEYKRKLDEAKLAISAFGDYSKLAEILGMDVSGMNDQQIKYILIDDGVLNEDGELNEDTGGWKLQTQPDYLNFLNTVLTSEDVGKDLDTRISKLASITDETGKRLVTPEDIMNSRQLDMGDPGYDAVRSAPPSTPATDTPLPASANSASVTNSVSGGKVFVDGTGYTWDELARAVKDDIVKYAYNSRTGKWTFTMANKPKKEGGQTYVADLQD